MKTQIITTLLATASVVSAATTAFISEFHYSNTGSDTGEFVEVYALTSVNASDLSVVLYNGNNSSSYATLSFGSASGTATYDGQTYNIYTVDHAGIQNGAPDGIALAVASALCQFISYEGSFSASGGIADGQASTDVGVLQTDSASTGSSIEFTDTGWVSNSTNTKGAANIGLVGSVPEPSSTALLGLGALTLVLRRRK